MYKQNVKTIINGMAEVDVDVLWLTLQSDACYASIWREEMVAAVW